ncbi:MAG TPA: adenylate/guanylate cyclase domain-containing protein [Actinoplanes sp.]|jgi:class 3 adenylate cyclase
MTTTTTRCHRQTVTVLFVDIVGYTTLVEDMDCADVRDLQTDYFGTVSAVIACGGGVVEKYVGDAVMAVFGADEGDAPVTAAAAAVRAGWEAQNALRGRRLAGRYPVRTRVGLATGAVIIDRDATRDGGYGMVSGSVVATAARLQQYAPADTVVVDGGTRLATDELVAYQELPPVAVAGRPYPMELWRALHPQAALCAA